MSTNDTTVTVKKRRGFAVMSLEKRQEIASRGGKAAHAAGVGHRFTADEARAAGRKGGLAPRKRRQVTKPTTESNEPTGT